MPSFTALLIQSCDIEQKTLSQSGYEKVASWTTKASAVPCRKDSVKVSVTDGSMRVSSDDDLFFFNPDATVVRGNRIVLDGERYDVLDVNKMLDSRSVHHLEVTARIVNLN